MPCYPSSYLRLNKPPFKLHFPNLTDHQLNSSCVLSPSVTITQDLLSLLSHPLTFIPTPQSANHRLVFRYVVDFVRKLQWRSTPLRFNNIDSRFGIPRSTNWPAPALVPPRIRTLSVRILSASKRLLFSRHLCFSTNNLSPTEVDFLSSIRSDPSIITRPSDKGNRWVITNRNDYRRECLHQLTDTAFYQPLQGPLFSSPPPLLDETLQRLCSRGFLSRRELRSLTSSQHPQPRRYNAQPKLHKSDWSTPNMPPARPVISDVRTDTSGIARLIDYFLFPLVSRLPSFLLDSSHLLALIQPLTLQPHSLLCTLDVRSLYTNVSITEGLRRVAILANAFRRFPDERRPDTEIISLLRHCLFSNDFSLREHLVAADQRRRDGQGLWRVLRRSVPRPMGTLSSTHISPSFQDMAPLPGRHFSCVGSRARVSPALPPTPQRAGSLHSGRPPS